MSKKKQRILIIKLSAIGDVVMATGAFHGIREHHPDAHIALLTTKSQMKILQDNPDIDEFIFDERKKPWHLGFMCRLYKNLSDWDFIYDLQNSTRTTKIYFRMAKWANKNLKWSGIAKGCSHPQPTEHRKNMHVVDMLNDQLKHAGISDANFWPNLTYRRESTDALIEENRLNLEKLVVLIPGCSPTRQMKRWPHYAALTKELMNKGYQVVLTGTNDEKEDLDNIEKETGCINLCNQVNLAQMIDLSARAYRVIGNDTGPMHIAAASGAKGVAVFGEASDVVRSSPRGEGITTIKKDPIGAITPQEVIEAALITD